MMKFIYNLALACWIGGASLFTFILTPTLFKSYSRDVAGGIVGVLFPGYFKWGLACGAIALATLFAASLSKFRLLAAGIIVLMLAMNALQALVIEPRAAELKTQIASFESTPPDDPFRMEFRKLHGISAACNLAVIGFGIALIFLQSRQ